MRSLHADLLAAQQTRSYEPYISCTVQNTVEAVRRLDYTILDTTSNTSARHDIAVAADGSVTRVRIDAGALKQQRVPPDSSPNWTTWNTRAAGIGTECACAARGARVGMVYNVGVTIYLKESTDSGQNYGAAVAIINAGGAITDLAVAYKNTTGDLGIAWTEAATLRIIIRNAGVWTATLTSPATFATLNGVALTYGLDWDILITGTEITTTRPTVWTVIYGDGNDAAAATWTTPRIQQQAEAAAATTFSCPFLAWVDTYRANYLETATYTGGAPRVYRMYLQPSLSYDHGAYTWRSPLPSNQAPAQGLALAAEPSATYTYESHPALVQRADTRLVTLDLAADVLAVDLDEDTRRVRCTVELNNDAGQYAGPPAPLALGNLIDLRFGYRTVSGNRTTTMPLGLWVAAMEHRRSGGRSTLLLTLESGWERLRRSSQRTSVIHTTSHYRAILSAIMARAGLEMTTNGSSTRAGAITPQLTIDPAQHGHSAATGVLQFLADRLRMMAASTVRLTEPLTGDASTYTFGTAHPIYGLEVRTAAAPLSAAQTFGAAAYGHAVDHALARHGLAPHDILRDLTSATGSAAGNTAVAHLRQRELDASHGRLIVPPNVGQELLDVITFTDGLVASGDIKRRVMGIHWRYDKRRSVYQQELRLGPL